MRACALTVLLFLALAGCQTTPIESTHLTESARTMNEIGVVGVDLGKSVIHVHGADERGKPLFQGALRRNRFEPVMANMLPCKV